MYSLQNGCRFNMDSNLLWSSINATPGIPLLKTHLLHILDTLQLLMNLERCTLSLTTEYGDDALSVSSSMEPASLAHAHRTYTHSSDVDTEETFQFQQPLELRWENVADAAWSQLASPGSHEATVERDVLNEHPSPPNTVSIIQLNVVRHSRFGRLTFTETYAIQRVLQSIHRAIAEYFEHRSDDYYGSVLERLLTHFRIGIIKLSPQLNIIEKSSQVDDLLASTTNYRCQSGRLIKIAPHDHRIVERAVDALHMKQLPYQFVDVVSTGNNGQCAIVVTQLAPRRDGQAGGYVVYILCSMADHFEASDLLDFWQITPAEKRVLAGLTRYGSIKKVALELGVSPNTVKSQLKSAYKKLGVDSKISVLRRFTLLRLINALTCTG